jgi:drug/metabolite transporter (DMT)-like permease
MGAVLAGKPREYTPGPGLYRGRLPHGIVIHCSAALARLMAPAASGTSMALLAAVLAAGSFVTMDSMIKLISPRYDALQLSFFRFASGSVYAVALWACFRSPLPRGRAWRLHGLRSVLLLMSLVGYFHALTVLPLAQTVAISYVAPIAVSLLAVWLLHERPSRWIWASLGLGLLGVFTSAWPELQASVEGSGGERLVGVLSVLGSALAFSGVLVLARRQSQHDSMWTILLVQNLLPALLLAPLAAPGWRPLQSADLLPIAAAGALATIGLLAITHAFSRLEASRVAPVEYTSFVWAAGLGWLLFGELPSAATAVSALLIVSGCLLLLRR